VIRYLLPLCLVPLVGACASSGNYPSLAKRDVERIAGSAQPAAAATAAVPALPPASADLLTRIDSLLTSARKAHADFTGKLPSTQRVVSAASGAAAASDSWVSAQTALAALQGSRSQVMVSLAELDDMYVKARDAAPETESPSALAIDTARRQVEQWAGDEDAVLSRLQSMLNS